MRSWFYLLGAICSEVIGTVSIKALAAAGCPKSLSLLFLYAMIALSYFLLALAVRRVALGLAFAMWEGFGIVFVTMISFFLGEELGPAKIAGVGLMIFGILLIKFGVKNASEQGERDETMMGAEHVRS